jgi:glycopeptide antibiotics resistance protein
MPFGMLLPIRWRALDRAWRMLGATLFFGLLIEALQFTMGLGRQASMSDVSLYVVGALAGYGLSRAARSWIGPQRG